MDDKLCTDNQWYGKLASYAIVHANIYEVLKELWKTIAVPNVFYEMNALLE